MKILLCLFACLLFVACGSDAQQSESQGQVAEQSQADARGDEHGDGDGHGHAEVAVQDQTVEAGTYTVACGCSIESVGHCGNYIEVAGQHVEIAGSEALGLSGMEWCGKPGATVVASGEVKDGMFVPTAFAVQ